MAPSPPPQQKLKKLELGDALSFLDQIQLQCGNHSQVYEDFLDIMKNFKLNAIDISDVIIQISYLFKGHPDLIADFTTFLPPGYKIEVLATEIIHVHLHGQQLMIILSTAMSEAAAAIQVAQQGTAQQQAANKTPPLSSSVAQSGSATDHRLDDPMRFVMKVEKRFRGQPEIYEAFLKILHTYRNDQRKLMEGLVSPSHKPVPRAELYSQIAELFQNEEDLLMEFSSFLLDASGTVANPGQSTGSEDEAPLR